jgi:potassium efflux system protein
VATSRQEKSRMNKLNLGVALLVALLLPSQDAVAEQGAPVNQKTVATQQTVPEVKDLSDIIPLATNLPARLIILESKLAGMPDPAPIEKQYAEIAARVDDAREQLQLLKQSDSNNFAKLTRLMRDLARENEVLTSVSKPVAVAIQRLDIWDKEWQAEKTQWSEWRTSLLKDRAFAQLGAVFEQAIGTINRAQSLIRREINILLAVQARGGVVQSKIDSLGSEEQTLIAELRKQFVFGTSLPMYAPRFYSELRAELWKSAWDGLQLLPWSDMRFVARHEYVYFLLLMLFVALLWVIFGHRQSLKESEHLRFIAERPVSTALFMCALITGAHLNIEDAPALPRVIFTVVGVVSCARLLGAVLKHAWKRHAAYFILISYIFMLVLISSDLPSSLFRLYTLIVSLLAIGFCVKWVRESAALKEARYYRLLLHLSALLFTSIVVADIWGWGGLAVGLFVASLQSMTVILAVILFVNMIDASLHWLFYSSPIRHIKMLHSHADELVGKIGFLLTALVLLFILLPAVLTAWKVFDTVPQAISSLLSPGFAIGSQRVSVGLILAAVGTLYGSFFISWIFPNVFLDEQFAGRRMERGARLSAGRLLQYFIVLIGFLLALTLLGIDWTKLTIILSAFGVGIGFGLQSIVNNLVSGLILLIERPLREGDTIEFNNARVHIKKIGLRATHVQTFEQADVIIPNADLITSPVTNWTLGNREVRLSIPVGVSYGSDIRLVGETLLACAKANDSVLNSPAPHVLFMNLGDSSLDFELRVWIRDADDRLLVKSQLYHEIVQKFREARIEIPFPQRDLHLRSAAESLVASTRQHPDQGIIPQDKPV